MIALPLPGQRVSGSFDSATACAVMRMLLLSEPYSKSARDRRFPGREVEGGGALRVSDGTLRALPGVDSSALGHGALH